MNFLSAFAQKLAPEQSLKARLHKHLAGPESGRSMTVLHASAVTKSDFCARRNAIVTATGIKPPSEYVSTASRVTYTQGRLLQDQVVNWCADMGIAVGDWKCAACGKLHRFQKRPLKCDNGLGQFTGGPQMNCGARDFHPVEVRFTSPLSGISGGFDMIVNLGSPKLRLTEIKTIKGEDFKALAAPLAEHKLRTALYLRIAAESQHPLSGHVDDQIATVLYLSKGHGVGDPTLKPMGVNESLSPFKEFQVYRDDALTDPLVKHGAAFWAWRHGKGGMPDRVCASAGDKKAKFCPAAQYCFGDVFPPGAVNENPIDLLS